MLTCVPSSCSEHEARPDTPSCCQMHIFRMLLVTSPSANTFLMEVIISSQASLFCSSGDWLWPRKCLLCMAAAEGEVCIYSCSTSVPSIYFGSSEWQFSGFLQISVSVNFTACSWLLCNRRGHHLHGKCRVIFLFSLGYITCLMICKDLKVFLPDTVFLDWVLLWSHSCMCIDTQTGTSGFM